MTQPTENTTPAVKTESGGSDSRRLLGTEHPYHGALWGVHVLGPGNVLAAHDFNEAITRCHEINTMLLQHIVNDPRFKDAHYMPRVFAQVAIWDDIASFPHEPDSTEWANACA